MKKENKTNKMLKIVYFDEISATDYLIIKNEGIAKEIEQHLTSKDREEKFDRQFASHCYRKICEI